METSRDIVRVSEVDGAMERPSGSTIRIEIDPRSGTYWVTVPPRTPGIVLTGALGFVVLVTCFGLGSGIADFAAHIKEFTGLGRAFVISGLIVTPAIEIGLLTVALRSFARTEMLTLSPERFVRSTRDLFGAKSTVHEISAVRGFELRRDPRGLMQSRLILRTGVGDVCETELCEGASESEKGWLGSVLNVILDHARSVKDNGHAED